ncbi:MAG: hypothetical protein AAGE94_21260, partial [Acidobacteriota bacterium]
IRQLRNVARRLAIAHATGAELQLDGILSDPPHPAAGGTVGTTETASVGEADAGTTVDGSPASDAAPRHGWRPAYRKPSDVSDEELLATLREHDYQLKASAEALGISRASLYLMVEATPQVRKASELEPDEVLDAMATAENDWVLAARALEVSVYALKRQVKALGLDLGSAVGSAGKL